MKITDWNASHLGKRVKILGENYGNYYRLERLTYEYGSDSVQATLVTIVPSPRPGILGHYNLASIELAE